MCGKNKAHTVSCPKYPGSPPHVREKLTNAASDALDAGITPACAGKTFKIGDSMPRGWDHPRMCGKNSISSNEVSHTPGSPPHVREKLFNDTHMVKTSGITPACAGKTRQIRRARRRYWDHPRMCGKNRIQTAYKRANEGSPPHVREKLLKIPV